MQHQGKLITEYLRAWPTLPSLTLARKIYSEHPEKWMNIDAIRSAIRSYRGTIGSEKRTSIKFREFYDQEYGIPETFAPDYEPYILPVDCNNILLLNDLHIPFHDPFALDQAIRWGKQHEVNTILLNGDVIDCYHLSRFIKDSRYPSIKTELKAAGELLDYLRHEFPEAVIYWKNGNHEERIESYLKIKAPELLDVLDWNLDTLLQFANRKIHLITEKRKIIAGKLTILHGHEFYSRQSGQVNPARTLFLKSYQSAIVGHQHITSEHTDKALDGEVITCWSVGCLCGLFPEYARLNRWNHGFARILLNDDGTYKVVNIRIINGKIY